MFPEYMKGIKDRLATKLIAENLLFRISWNFQVDASRILKSLVLVVIYI